MEEPHEYPLANIKRILNFPYRLKAIGWMPHHIYFHRHAEITDFFVCISSNSESQSERIVNGVVQTSTPYRLPHFGFVLPGSRIHTIRASYHDELFFVYDASAMRSFQELFGGIVAQDGFHFTGMPTGIVAEIRLRLKQLDRPGTADRLDQLAVQLFSEIILHHREELEGKDSLNLKLHSIAALLLEGKKLPDVLKHFAVSERTFYREWHTAFSGSPRKYLLQCRMEDACSLLTGTDLPLGDIAEKCGFSSNVYFHQIFQKRFFMTPGEYRKKNRTRLFDGREDPFYGSRPPVSSTE